MLENRIDIQLLMPLQQDQGIGIRVVIHMVHYKMKGPDRFRTY